MNEQEIWYEVEVSRADEDNWCRYGNDYFDTENSARLMVALVDSVPNAAEWKFQVVEVTVTRKVIGKVS